MVTFATVGTCTIDATQPGNTDYTAAPEVSQSVAVGEASSTPGVVYTSGSNNSGQLGNGTETDAHSPVQALLGTGLTATQVSGGPEDSAAVVRGCQSASCTPKRRGLCLGKQPVGGTWERHVGNHGKHHALPGRLPGKDHHSGGKWEHVARGTFVDRVGLHLGQQQFGPDRKRHPRHATGCDCISTPTQVALGSVVTQVAEGSFTTYALTSTGQVYAWGDNEAGEAGGGFSNSFVLTPVAVPLPAGTVVTAISANYLVAMALTSTGAVYMWGGEADITGSASESPTPVSLPGGVAATAIATGSESALALTAAGQVYAWGLNGQGELGNGSFSSAASPPASPALVQLPGGTDVTSIAAGHLYGLALTSTGAVYGWGDNSYGALGLGTTTNVDTPTQMDLPSGVAVGTIGAGQGYHSIVISQLAPQTITFTSTPPASGAIDSTYNVLAEATSGLTVSLSIAPLSASVCSIAGTHGDLRNAGDVHDRRQPGGRGNFRPCTSGEPGDRGRRALHGARHRLCLRLQLLRPVRQRHDHVRPQPDPGGRAERRHVHPGVGKFLHQRVPDLDWRRVLRRRRRIGPAGQRLDRQQRCPGEGRSPQRRGRYLCCGRCADGPGSHQYRGGVRLGWWRRAAGRRLERQQRRSGEGGPAERCHRHRHQCRCRTPSPP